MEADDWRVLWLVLRRVLAGVELCVAVLCLWFLGFDALTAPHAPGDVMGGEALRIVAPYFIVVGLALALAAVTAWRGGRWWWVWQVAAAAVTVGVPVIVVMYAMSQDA